MGHITYPYYTVWVRSDGYINASAHSDPEVPKYLSPERFEILLTTNDWPTAQALVAERRANAIAAGTYPDWATKPNN